MSRLQQLAKAVDLVYAEVGEKYSRYQRDRGLFCRSGCGECCLHPGIEATVLEMLPLAFELVEQGKADETLAALTQYDADGCFFYQRFSADGKQGQCGVYSKRPGICRLFGAAGYNGREGEVLLSVCKNIKADHPIPYADTLIALESDPPPMIRNGKEQIRQIDYELGGRNFPINEAMQLALEKVLFEQYYSAYAMQDAAELLANCDNTMAANPEVIDLTTAPQTNESLSSELHGAAIVVSDTLVGELLDATTSADLLQTHVGVAPILAEGHGRAVTAAVESLESTVLVTTPESSVH